MAFTTTDFDQVDWWTDGAGWTAVFEIHRGIKERCEAVGHPLRLTTYADEFEGRIWTQENTGQPKQFLKSLLQQSYNSIGSLVGGYSHIRFTEASGRSSEWTLASLVADIGMGEFAALLTRPQNPEPFMWLQEALNRLIYAKGRATPRFTDQVSSTLPAVRDFPGEYAEGRSYFGGSVRQDAWDDLIADPANWRFTPMEKVALVGWFLQNQGIAKYDAWELPTCDSVSYKNAYGGVDPNGIITAVDYVCDSLSSKFTGTSLYVTVGGSPSTEFTYPHFGIQTVIIESGADFSVGGSEEVSISLDTSKPSTIPFDEPSAFAVASVTISLAYIWLYFDIAAELTDQEP